MLDESFDATRSSVIIKKKYTDTEWHHAVREIMQGTGNCTRSLVSLCSTSCAFELAMRRSLVS